MAEPSPTSSGGGGLSAASASNQINQSQHPRNPYSCCQSVIIAMPDHDGLELNFRDDNC